MMSPRLGDFKCGNRNSKYLLRIMGNKRHDSGSLRAEGGGGSAHDLAAVFLSRCQ